MSTISFDLVSPEQLLFNDKVGMIIVPGKDGDIGVLPGHSKLLSSLRSGKVMVYGEDKSLLKSFFVTGGFIEMNSLDKSSLEKEVQELENQDNDESKEKLMIATKKIEALNSKYYEKIN